MWSLNVLALKYFSLTKLTITAFKGLYIFKISFFQDFKKWFRNLKNTHNLNILNKSYDFLFLELI